MRELHQTIHEPVILKIQKNQKLTNMNLYEVWKSVNMTYRSSFRNNIIYMEKLGSFVLRRLSVERYPKYR